MPYDGEQTVKGSVVDVVDHEFLRQMTPAASQMTPAAASFSCCAPVSSCFQSLSNMEI